MCGFIGYYNSQRNIEEDIPLLYKGMDNIKHRGPDSEGVFKDVNIFLGHRRLSIIDLTKNGHQPRVSSDSQVVLVFNGEIYNYRDLAKELLIEASSDTEVLLEGYRSQGVSFFKKLRGVFAFSIYDKRCQKLILARDHAGVKPLYYFHNHEQVCFGSEIKALKPLLHNKLSTNENQIWGFLNLGYCQEPETVYNEIATIEPGTYYEIDLTTMKSSVRHFFGYDFGAFNSETFDTNKELTRGYLEQAVARNLVSDVPVRIALSGGIDSSLIYALANKNDNIAGLTVRMEDEQYDESEIAKAYAGHLNRTNDIITTEVGGKIDLLDNLLLHFDQPYADSSLIPFYFLNKYAAKYTKVLIGGDSGDEIHGGYSGYKILPILHKLQALKPLSTGVLNMMKSFPLGGEKKRQLNKFANMIAQPSFSQALFYWNSWFPTSNKFTKGMPFKNIEFEVSNAFSEASKIDSGVLALINKSYFRIRMQSDYLRKSDMMSMLNGIEFRVPMLDEDLAKHSLSIPYDQKISFSQTKKILRSIHADIYPAQLSKLKKKGFSIPLDTWLGNDNVKYIEDYLLRSDGIILNYVNQDYVSLLTQAVAKNKHRKIISRESAYQRLLMLYALQLWYLRNN